MRLYTETLGFKEVYREIVFDQGVEAVGLEAGASVIELLLPLDEKSPIARYPWRLGDEAAPHGLPRRGHRSGACEFKAKPASG